MTILLAMVKPLTVGDDPSIEIYHVELSHKDGIWTETFGSKEQLNAFMRGLEAASGMVGFTLQVADEHEWSKR